MSINLLSSNIVSSIKEKLLTKINKLIAKRSLLFQNMNLYSLQQLTKLITQINEQLALTVQQARIMEVEDIPAMPADNLMSMSDSKSLVEPTQAEESKSTTSSKVVETYRMRRLSILTRTERADSFDPSKAINLFQNKGSFIPLKSGDGEKDSRQIEAYREMKRREFEERAKKLAHQIHIKQRVPINLNVEDVVYDYEGDLTRLEKSKEKKFKTIPQVLAGLRQHEYDQKKKRHKMRELALRNAPSAVTEKINVTLREAQAEKEKKNRQRSYTRSSFNGEDQSITGLVKVNLESHKEHEEAIAVRQPGVKITIKEREFSAEKQTGKALTKITRRLSRSEYIQFKADEQKKKIIKNATLRFIEKSKPRPQEPLKADPVKQVPKTVLEDRKPNHRLSLTLDNSVSSRDKSRIFIHNVLGKAQLVKEIKQKPYLTESNEQKSSQRESMSTVDKYSLLYVKYNGNPPEATYENITQELQTQRKEVQKIKENVIHPSSAKKQSFLRENRIITSRVN